MNKTKKVAAGIAAIMAVMAVGIVGIIYFTQNNNKSSADIQQENTLNSLAKLTKDIKITEAKAISSPLTGEESGTLEDSLPDLSDEDLVVTGEGDINLVIWSSPEKAGTNEEAWLSQLCREFNEARYMSEDGEVYSVSLRSISSGLANDYIASGKDQPDLYTPSADIWGKMLEAEGVKTETILEKTTSNVAGLFIKNKVYDQLQETYGTVNLKAVVTATANGEIQTGYTNPYTSTTGLNFLVSTLYNYDASDIFSSEAVEGFRSFQEHVPYVATTSNQMVQSAENGSFDVFVGESQQYNNSVTYKTGYQFIPFGTRHDNPLYAIGDVEDKKDAIACLKEVLTSDEAALLASRKGFGTEDSYISEITNITGEDYIQAQSLWKTEKDSQKTIAAFFISDVSGSMDGTPLLSLQNSLLSTMSEISSDAYIGLITYSDNVEIARPLSQFTLSEKALFKGAVENMYASGGTATNNAVLVALEQIASFQQENPDMNISPKIILLSDGYQNTGYGLDEITDVVRGMQVPIYTICYNDGDTDTLTALAEVNEAACLDAQSEDILIKLRDLFRINL